MDTPFVEWEQFYREFRWRQGDHVTFLGQTECGKTTFALNVLDRRAYHVILVTKRKDPQLDRLKKRGYIEVKEWNEIIPELGNRWLLRPPLNSLDGASQQRCFYDALNGAFRTGKWTVYADEVRYLTDTLKLRNQMEILWLQGRTLKLSIVAATQRPAHIPLEAYSQASHLFFWRTTDDRDLRRVSEIGGTVDGKKIRQEIPRLRNHEALYVCARNGQLLRTKVPKELVK